MDTEDLMKYVSYVMALEQVAEAADAVSKEFSEFTLSELRRAVRGLSTYREGQHTEHQHVASYP